MKHALRGKIVTSITLMAFVMSVFLPFFAVYSIPSANAAQQNNQSSVFGDKILICTKNGFKWVSVEDLGDEEHDPESSNHLKCAVCYVSAHGVKDVLLSKIDHPLPVQLKQIGAFDLALDESRLKDHLLLFGRLSRAPPALV